MGATVKKRVSKPRDDSQGLREILTLQQEQTAMLIHDIKGPLGEIIANLDLLASENLSGDQRDYVETAQQGCNTLLQMVLNLLDIHKMEEGRLVVHQQEFDFREVVESCMSSLHCTAAAKGVRFDLQESTGGIPVTGDRNLLERVALNLLMNSIEYSPEGGIVFLKLVQSQSGDQVLLTVTDQGRGIPYQYQELIFQKFARVERDGEKRPLSTGLGLTFCKMAVEAHNGRIWVQSQNHHGSTFGIEIPVGSRMRWEP